jgi:putative membrane protein
MHIAKLALVATLATGMMGYAQTMGQTSDQSASKAGQHAAKASKGAKGADATFATKAAQGGLAEVELGKLAKDKAQSDDVKQFGQKMVDDHSKANDDLKQVAQKNNMTLPTDVSAKDKATMDRLSKLSGAAFDKAYMRNMVTDHTKDSAEFHTEASSGTNPDLKDFAGKYSPTIDEHLKMAKDINSKLAGGSTKSKEKPMKPSASSPDRQ